MKGEGYGDFFVFQARESEALRGSRDFIFFLYFQIFISFLLFIFVLFVVVCI